MCRWAHETHRRAPQKLLDQTQIGRLLYDHGCHVAVNTELIKSLPSLAAYMLAKGERCGLLWSVDRVFQALAEAMAGGAIGKGELVTIMAAMKRRYVNKSDLLDRYYLDFINGRLSITTLREVNDEIPDICCRRSTFAEESTAEWLKAAVAVFAPLGMHVDTGQLRDDLHACGQNEKANLYRKRQLDRDRLPEVVEELAGEKRRLRGQATSRWILDFTLRTWSIELSLEQRPLAGTTGQTGCPLLKDLGQRRVQELNLFERLYNPATGERTPAVPLGETEAIVDALIDGHTETAKVWVDWLYERRFGRIEEKKQAVETLCQQIDELQSREVSRTARLQLTSRQGEVEPDGQRVLAGPISPWILPVGLFNWLTDLFLFAPDSTEKSYPELAQLAIDHYYRTAHPGQVEQLAREQKPLPELSERKLGIDHATRMQILAEALLELLARHDQDVHRMLEQHSVLRDLIPLATLYYPLTAGGDQSSDSMGVAQWFERDMNASGRYPQQLVKQVATALGKDTEEKCSQGRTVGRVIRLAERIDRFSAAAIPEDWKESWIADCELDLGAPLSVDLARDFDALLEGAKALAYVTGGAPESDLSGSYFQRHRLRGNNDQQRKRVAWADSAYGCVSRARDDNVRRTIGEMAGVVTCAQDHSRESLQQHAGRLPCVVTAADDRDTLTTVHSELELRQIQIPDAMTAEQKLGFNRDSMARLSAALQRRLEQEIKRLQEHGIRPPLVRLSQEVLSSPRARKRRNSHYRFEVSEHKRACQGESDGSR